MSESKTPTGRTEGSSEGGTFREDQSKHRIRLSTQSMLRFPSSGHHIGTRSSGGGVGCGGGGDGGCGASSAVGEMPLVAAESGGGGGTGAESA